MKVDRSRFLALVAAIAGSACGSPAPGATAPRDAAAPEDSGVPVAAPESGGTAEADGNAEADGSATGAIDATGADGGGHPDVGDASGDSKEDETALQADGQSSDAPTSEGEAGVVKDAAADTSACANTCGGTCCAEGSVCVDDGRGNKQCGKACTDSVQCPSSAPCCGPAQEGLCGNVGTTWACLPTNLCAGEYCRCSSTVTCGPAQEGLSRACAPLIGQSGTVSPPLCNAPGARTSLYIHGRVSSGSAPANWDYWKKPRPGVLATPVNWGGAATIENTNQIVRAALNTYCTGNNWCYVACHSAGCAQIGYALDMYGATAGVDTWNIHWIAAAGSAEGGSEIADSTLAAVSQILGGGVPLDADLKVMTMRSLYNHNNTAGVIHYMFAGDGTADSCTLCNGGSALLPGANDEAVAYHSAGGVNNIAYNAQTRWCNATDSSLGCNFLGSVLPLGMSSDLWALHTVYFLDDAGSYSHYLADANEGICSQMFAFMTQNAL